MGKTMYSPAHSSSSVGGPGVGGFPEGPGPFLAGSCGARELVSQVQTAGGSLAGKEPSLI